MSLDDLANLYTMLNVLVSPEAGRADRELGSTKTGRENLCEKYRVDHSEGVGKYFVEYASGEFNSFIQSIINNAILTMTENEGREQIDHRAKKPPRNFPHTNMFDMLAKLTKDPDVRRQFQALFPGGTDEAQNKWLAAHLGTNNYGEHDAIKKLMSDPNDKEKAAKLKDSMNAIITSFWTEYQLCC